MNLPTAVAKRDILAKNRDNPDVLMEYAELFIEEGFTHDAVDFLIAAGAVERLEEFYREAFEEGDLFQARRLAGPLGRSLSPGEWETLGDNARKRGKLLYAQQAYARAEAGGKLEAVKKEAAEVFGPDAAALKGV